MDQLPFKKDDNGIYLEVTDLVKFLKENQIDSDAKIIKKQNIIREVAKYKDRLHEEADGTRIPISSIFRYLFSHFDDFRVCAELCNDVIEHCTSKSQTPPLQKTHWSLYEKLKATVFTPNQIEIHTVIKETDLEFLDTNWKKNYSETEWDRIKLFEWNFQNSVSTKNRVQFESLIEKKYNFYELCKSVQENAETIGPIVVKTMKKNFARKTASNALQGILVKGNMKHNPELIEKDILELIESHIAPSFSKKVYCVDCNLSCLHRNGLHIYIELSSTPSISVLDDIVVLITSHIEKTHSEWTKEVIFFKNGTFPEQLENVPPRFNTRDKIKLKQLNDQIYYSALIDNEEDLDISENCIKKNYVKPASIYLKLTWINLLILKHLTF